MMTKKQVADALRLRKSGMSVRDVARAVRANDHAVADLLRNQPKDKPAKTKAKAKSQIKTKTKAKAVKSVVGTDTETVPIRCPKADAVRLTLRHGIEKKSSAEMDFDGETGRVDLALDASWSWNMDDENAECVEIAMSEAMEHVRNAIAATRL